MKRNFLFNLVVAAVALSAGLAFGTSAYDNTVLGDSPVSYWPMQETTGPTIHDMVGANNGTLMTSTDGTALPNNQHTNFVTAGAVSSDGATYLLGGPGAVAGDTAIYFTNLNGSVNNSQIVVPYVAALDPAGTFTAEAWIKIPTYPIGYTKNNYQTALGLEANGGAQNGWWMDLETDGAGAGTGFFQFNLAKPPGSGWTSPTASSTSSGRWVHAVEVCTGGTNLTCYTNGVQMFNTTWPTNNYESEGTYGTHKLPFIIGSYCASYSVGNNILTGFERGNFWHGGISHVAIYNHALTAGQVANHYISGTATGLPYGLTNRAAISPYLNMPDTYDGPVPLFLSQTGVFTDTPSMTPVNGLIPYVPNTALWSDGALKTRYVAVPYDGGPITTNSQINFATNGSWFFPDGTVFVKTFQLNVDTTRATNVLHRLETRLLVRDANGDVYGVTYKWRTNNSDADLLSDSLSEDILVTNTVGVVTQTWYYPSPNDCLTCHTPVANYVLGVNSRQLNGSQTYPATGVTDNQLRTLNRLGLFNPAIDESAITNFEKLSALTNLSASLQDRARSYLDANCSQCHQPGGDTRNANFDARYDTPLSAQNLTNVPVNGANLGISDNACVIKNRDVWRSVLLDRMNTNDSFIQMPPLARNLIDTNAVQVMGDWINSLPGTPALAPPTIQPGGGSFTGVVSVVLSQPDTNALIYYTVDGSTPTTNSLRYTGAVNLYADALVEAAAWETGFDNSIVSVAPISVEPLNFSSAGFLTNRQFQLGFSGASGDTYVLQASTNLVTWTSLSTNIAPGNQFYLLDPSATNYPRRYYRVLKQ